MNFKLRLNKMERLAQTKPGSDCQCFNKHNEAILNRLYGDPYNTKDVLPDRTTLEGICRKCGNTINGQVKGFYERIAELYGGANEY